MREIAPFPGITPEPPEPEAEPDPNQRLDRQTDLLTDWIAIKYFG